MSGARRTSESRERILRAAVEVVREHGYGGTTIARITERAGLPASSVYWFFEDKDALLAEVVLHQVETWLGRSPAWRRPGPGEDPVAVLGEVLGPGMRAMAQSPDHLRLGQSLVLEPRARGSAARSRFLSLRGDATRALEEWFVDVLDRGTAPAPGDLARELARLVVVAWDGLFLSFRAGDALDPDVFLDLLLDTVAEALRSG